jgi:hypothetical protein
MALLDARYHATIQQTILDRVKHYEDEAKARLQMKPQPTPTATDCAKDASSAVGNSAAPSVATTPESPPAVTKQPADRGQDWRAEVVAFVASCNRISTFTVYKKHIWLAVGHSGPRQFERWQSKNAKVTKADHRNFSRILAMEPAAFIALLKERGIA